MSAASLQVSIAVANWTVAVANVVLFVIAFWSLRSDRRRLSKMEMADRQKYAENVYAWIEERSADTLTIACRNGGASTIYDVTIRVEDPTGKVLGDTYGIELMKPLEEKTCLATGMSMARDARLSVEFRDPGGLRWNRSWDGRLTEDAAEVACVVAALGAAGQVSADPGLPAESRRRSLVKTIVWRVVGVLWTWIGAYLIIVLVPRRLASGAALATMIVVYHHTTRMVMYYAYERAWQNTRWGLVEGDRPPMRWWEIGLWVIGACAAVAAILWILTAVSPMIEGKGA